MAVITSILQHAYSSQLVSAAFKCQPCVFLFKKKRNILNCMRFGRWCLHIGQVPRLKCGKNACFSNNPQCSCLWMNLNGHFQYGPLLSTLLGWLHSALVFLIGFSINDNIWLFFHYLFIHFYSSFWIVRFLWRIQSWYGNFFHIVGGGFKGFQRLALCCIHCPQDRNKVCDACLSKMVPLYGVFFASLWVYGFTL